MRFPLTLTALLALQTASIAAQRETVTILRDTYGVPHIYADTNEGVMFGHGYAQAEDHLEAMIKNFIQASGRLSEYFGVDDPNVPGPDNGYLVSDVIVRNCKVREMVEDRYHEIDPQVRSMVEAYAAGINLYISENAASLPSWVLAVAPLTGIDPVARARWFEVMSDVVLALDELREVDRPLTSSNEWVVDETKTANGCVMVQIDPHVPWTPDLRMYEVHLKGGDFNAIGATTFGSPFVIIGHNDIFACAITANAPDLADVYIETLNDTNTRYLFDGQWYDLTVEPTTIKILNSSPVTITRIYTHFGERVVVKVNWKDHIAYSARLVSMPVVRAFEQSFKLNTARDLVEFKQALAMCLIPSRNIAYGDIYGNIYYCYNARQPLKSPFYDWTRPVDGSTSDTEWGELMEFEDLPQIENPPSDYLINCNVPPWLVTEDSGIDPDDYPPYLFHKAPDGSGGITNTFRQIRAKDLIADDSSLTFEELRNTAFDSYLITAERAKLLIEVSVNDSIARFLVDDSLGLIDPAYQVLDAWDNFADKDGTGTALFSVCYELEPAWLPVDTIIDPNELTLQHRVAILKVLVEGATSLYDLHGRLDVTWADVHKISRGVDAFSVGGSNRWEQSLRSASTDHLLDGIGYCEEGSAYMMLVSLSQPVQAVSAKPHGQSEDPSSPHFSDLTELYSQDQFKPAWFLLDDILNNLESTTVLTYDGDKYGVRAECDQEHLPVSAQVCRAKVHCSSE